VNRFWRTLKVPVMLRENKSEWWLKGGVGGNFSPRSLGPELGEATISSSLDQDLQRID
jgi:hypothetical protein